MPSPHPSFYGKRSRVSVVQYLLKKHIQSQSLSPVVPPPAATSSTNSVPSPSIISDAPSPFHQILSSSTASPLTGAEDLTSTPGGDEYDTGNSTPCPCPAELEVNELTCIVELDDVLEASFLDDSMDRECEPSSSLVPSSGAASDTATTPSVDSTAAEASNKHLARWDVISIGAFRQTREQQQQAWGPGSRSSDYGGVIKSGVSAAGSALLWQNSSASSTGGGGSSKTTRSTPRSTKPPTSRSSTKAAKRRRLMMASSMSSPLVLPLSSTSLSTSPSKCHSSSLVSHSHPESQPSPSAPQKTRKELRREKKLLKKKMTTSSSPSSSSMPHQPPSFFTTHPYTAHPNNASNNNNHHFHIHQHHPNSKTRGTSSSQRTGYYGGSVPPLNL